MHEPSYIGRFAPSPSGPLHLGSLACALASYFDAKAHFGRWLLRIEDIDPPREQQGADKLILKTLQSHGLHADETVLFQSTRTQQYTDALTLLNRKDACYRCNCNRKRLTKLHGSYDGHCRNYPPKAADTCAIRLNVSAGILASETPELSFTDRIQGKVSEDFSESGDFIVHRKDGLFAYQLAVSVDDMKQGITHVVRGCDLLETTPKQILLISLLGGHAPSYAHIPVLAYEPGIKLSKQNHAPAIENTKAKDNIARACKAIGLVDAPTTGSLEALLQWGIENWSIASLKNRREIMLSDLGQG